MNKQKDQLTYKIIIIGDCGVGKTNLLLKFCQKSFKDNYVATIGVDFKVKTINVKGQKIKLQIWDTAGQQRFKNITQAYYKGAVGVILLYSVADSRSYQNIQRWIKQVNQHASPQAVKILVGNKCDISDRVISIQEGKTLARRFNLQHIQSSALDGTNVNKIFDKIGQKLLTADYIIERSECTIIIKEKQNVKKSICIC